MPESKVRKTAAEKRKRSAAKSTSTKDSAKGSAKASEKSVSKSSDKVSGTVKSTATNASSTADAAASTVRKRVSRVVEEVKPKRPWLLPVSIVIAVIGIAWGALYLIDDKLIGFMHSLGKWNIAIGIALIVIAAVLYLVLRPRTGTPYAPGSRRWVAPGFIGVGLLGVAWLLVYYVAGSSIPFMAALGNWNILIGMAGMAASFVIATLWK